MLRFTDDKFDIQEQPTIGVDFKVKHLEVDGERIYLQIWVSSICEHSAVRNKTNLIAF